jgi:gamma-glutamylcyclotransferase (GGCT)/AIG2-like uncharacterized protein YtfP
MPATVDHLFVYGTLRRGCDNRFAQLLSERGRFVCEARVRGRLYDFGHYPGAGQPDAGHPDAGHPDETIKGEIFYLGEPGLLLAGLDEYEGAEFERAVVPANLDDGRIIDCWIYWYAGPAGGSPIVSGDWLAR